MTNDERWHIFIEELRAYVMEHHLFPDKHTRLSHKVKYTRKKINEGTLEEWKRVMFEEIANSRDLTIHTGGRKKTTQENEDENVTFGWQRRRPFVDENENGDC